jgi:hypothetical protein
MTDLNASAAEQKASTCGLKRGRPFRRLSGAALTVQQRSLGASWGREMLGAVDMRAVDDALELVLDLR